MLYTRAGERERGFPFPVGRPSQTVSDGPASRSERNGEQRQMTNVRRRWSDTTRTVYMYV